MAMAMAAPAALQRSVVSPAGRHTASLIFLHGSGGCFPPLLSPATPRWGRGAGQGLGGRRFPLGKGAAVPPRGGRPPTAGPGWPPPRRLLLRGGALPGARRLGVGGKVGPLRAAAARCCARGPAGRARCHGSRQARRGWKGRGRGVRCPCPCGSSLPCPPLGTARCWPARRGLRGQSGVGVPGLGLAFGLSRA